MSEAQAPAAPAAPIAEGSAPQTEEIVDDGADLQEEGSAQAAAPAAEGKAPAKAVAKAADKMDAEKVPGTKMYKLVVDGEEEEVTEAQLVTMAQKAKGADKKFSESAQIRKEAAQLVKMLKDDPEAILADPAILGSHEKVLELAQKILARKIEDEQKSPEVLRAEKAEKELEQYRKEKKDEEDARQASEYEKMVKEQEVQMEEQITEAIGASGLPKSPHILKRLTDVLISAHEGKREITPKQAMNIVKREWEKELKQHFDLSADDVLEQLLGDDNIKRLRKRQLAKVKAQQVSPPAAMQAQRTPATAPKTEDKPKKESIRDWLRGK
jgi:hypothetical protein